MPDSKLSGPVARTTAAVPTTTTAAKSTTSACSQPMLTSVTPVTSSAVSRQLQRSRSMRSTIGPSAGSVTPLRRQLTDDEMKRKPRVKSGRSMTSISLAAKTPADVNTPTSTPSTRKLSRTAWNSRSLISTGSGLFTTEPIAKNGTTFSARCNRYVVHCAKKVDSEELYLTPTQRSTRDLKRLRLLLDRAHQTIRHRDAEIARLKSQLANTQSHGERSGSCEQLNVSVSSDNATVGSQPSCYDNAIMTSPATTLPSVADSGNYDCLTCYSSSGGSKESVRVGAGMAEADAGCSLESTLINGAGGVELEERLGDDWEASERWIEWEEKHLREDHERQIAELGRQHMTEFQEMKETYNNKIETLLEQLSDANTRYYQLRPQYDNASLRVRQLELELAAIHSATVNTSCQTVNTSSPQSATTGTALPLNDSSATLEATPTTNDHHTNDIDDEREVFTERTDEVDSVDLSRQMALLGSGSQSSVYEKQLSSLIDNQVAGCSSEHSLNMDPLMRLQFLRSAVYHLLTDRVNHSGHVTAIGAVLQFSEQQSRDIEIARQERRGSVV